MIDERSFEDWLEVALDDWIDKVSQTLRVSASSDQLNGESRNPFECVKDFFHRSYSARYFYYCLA